MKNELKLKKNTYIYIFTSFCSSSGKYGFTIVSANLNISGLFVVQVLTIGITL